MSFSLYLRPALNQGLRGVAKPSRRSRFDGTVSVAGGRALLQSQVRLDDCWCLGMDEKLDRLKQAITAMEAALTLLDGIDASLVGAKLSSALDAAQAELSKRQAEAGTRVRVPASRPAARGGSGAQRFKIGLHSVPSVPGQLDPGSTAIIRIVVPGDQI